MAVTIDTRQAVNLTKTHIEKTCSTDTAVDLILNIGVDRWANGTALDFPHTMSVEEFVSQVVIGPVESGFDIGGSGCLSEHVRVAAREWCQDQTFAIDRMRGCKLDGKYNYIDVPLDDIIEVVQRFSSMGLIDERVDDFGEPNLTSGQAFVCQHLIRGLNGVLSVVAVDMSSLLYRQVGE